MGETRRAAPRWMRPLRWLAGLALVPLLLHFTIIACTAMQPPSLPEGSARVVAEGGLRRLGPSYARKRGAIREVRLVGGPVEMGQAHVALLYDDLVAIEGELHGMFGHYVPYSLARTLLVDLSRLRFRHLDQVMQPHRRLEIAAQAQGFSPDPFDGLMPTYQRFIFLHSLYDIMLSFERSPLVGCSSVVLTGAAVEGGHTLLARNFDFEGPQVLDDKKAVFLAFEPDRIPYAAVSWPGFVGVTTGMNREGLGIVIHGARAGEPRTDGEPVAHTVRELLARASDVTAALALLADREPMVSHMLLLVDAAGRAAVVERVPGAPPFVRYGAADKLPLTNHLEGPFADDPSNQRVMAGTSTLARRRRLDEILEGLTEPATAEQAVHILRDKQGAGEETLPLGHRSAIDALIATHSVVMDATARELWVSEGPHATGRFVRFDLRALLDPSFEPSADAIEALPEDPIVGDGRFRAWVEAGRPHPGVE